MGMTCQYETNNQESKTILEAHVNPKTLTDVKESSFIIYLHSLLEYAVTVNIVEIGFCRCAIQSLSCRHCWLYRELNRTSVAEVYFLLLVILDQLKR